MLFPAWEELRTTSMEYPVQTSSYMRMPLHANHAGTLLLQETYDGSKYHWKSDERYVTDSVLSDPAHIEWLHN